MVMAVGTGACQQASEHEVRQPLRVSAGHQLTCFGTQSSSSAYARELVSPFVTDHAVVEHRDATTVALWPQGPALGPRVSASELCDRVFADGARAIVDRAVEGGACVLGFDSPDSKTQHGAYLRLDMGPYRLAREVLQDGSEDCPCTRQGVPDDGAPAPLLERMELVRRYPPGSDAHGIAHRIDRAGVDEIHLIAMPLQEQWRRLLAREIDVVPSAPTMYRSRLGEMRSVRTVPLPSSSAMALYFNIRAGPWSTPGARRRLAALLDLDAVARVACRDPACRDLGPYALALSPGPDSGPGGQPGILPARVSITLMAGDSVSIKAAQVISYRLRSQLDIEVVLDPRPVTGIEQVSRSGEFDVLLLPLGLPGRERTDELIERIRIGGWRNAEFERAVERADHEDIAAILQAEVPVVPLFRYMQFAAIDEHYCGGAPSSQTSWLWLADLVPCRGAKAR